MISLIAAIDENYGLGKNNQLLCHLPADLQHFKALTLNKTIIMGRNTYLSIGKPLPHRRNIVLSQSLTVIEGVEVFASLTQALADCKNEAEIMIIGGAQVYEQALPLANHLYLTQIAYAFDADVFFPHFDEAQWQCIDKKEYLADEKNQYAMTFLSYQRRD